MIVLAVDDKKLPLEALADAIEKAEPTAEIHSFSNPENALLFAEQNHVDVAFLDIDMREMNGIALAKKLKLKKHDINIIFATGYSEYAGDAIALHCSGYLMKPITPEKVRHELDDLRHPVRSAGEKRVRFQTFGNFEVFIDGQPISFKYEKTKELLAFLVDRGTVCTNSQIMAVLFEDEVSSSYIRHLYKDLLDVLKNNGCENILIRTRGNLGILPHEVTCDYYDWKLGKPYALNAYRGEYMAQYSWSEFTHGAMEFDK